MERGSINNNTKEFIKLSGEAELRDFVFYLEEELRNKVNSFFVIPKEVEAVDKLEIFSQLLDIAINYIDYLVENGFNEEEYEKLKYLLEDDDDNEEDLEKTLEKIEKQEIIDELKTIYKMKERVSRLFILKNLDFLKKLNKKQIPILKEILLAIDLIRIRNKKGEVDINSATRSKKILEEYKNSSIKTKEIVKSFLEMSGLSKVTPSPEFLQYLINSTVEEKVVYYKEEYEEDYYEIKIIPFAEIIEIKSIETDTEFIISRVRFKYGVVSNKYLLIKEGKIIRGKNTEMPQKIIFNKKITNLFIHNSNYKIYELCKNEEGFLEDLVYNLKSQVYEGIEPLLKKVAVTEDTSNQKVGFFFKQGKLKANYVRGSGLVKHNGIEFNLGSPISLLYSDTKSENLFYDYYTFKNSEKTFEEPPILYTKLLSIIKRLKEKKHPYLYPLLTVIGFTFSSIFIELFKKRGALYPGLYFYGLKGTGKSLLLKLSRAILGIKDNRVCLSFAQFRDLLSSSNNIAYLDEVPEGFDKKSEGKELLKNLATSEKTEQHLSGKEGDTFVMRGTFFITTNEPIDKVFGKDAALEERMIFVNFNYDNKIDEETAKELKQIVDELPQRYLSPTEKGYTLLTNVIYLYYQLIKKGYHEEVKVKEIIKKYEKFVENLVRLKIGKVVDIPRFVSLINPILVGIFIFSEVVNKKEIFEEFQDNLEDFMNWVLKEHPSYSFSIREQMPIDFVKYVGSLTKLLAMDVFDLKYISKEKNALLTNEDVKRKLIILLKNDGVETNKVFFMKKNDDYYILTREEFIKEFYKDCKDFYNYKKIDDLKSDLSRVGIRDEGVKQIRKKLLVIDGIENKVYIKEPEVVGESKRVKVKKIKVPKFFVKEIDNKLIRDLDKEQGNKISGEVKIEDKEGKEIQTKITDYFEDYISRLNRLGNLELEIELNENEQEIEEELI